MTPFAALPYMLGFLMPVLVVISTLHGGAWLLLPAGTLLVLVPLLDHAVGPNLHVRSAYEIAAFERNPTFRLVTWLWVPLKLLFLTWAIAWAGAAPRSPLELVGIAISVGATTGVIGATFAHELMHRRRWFERAMAEFLLVAIAAPHHAIDHILGHHRHLATLLDTGTARYGESFPAFLVRSSVRAISGAARLEAERLRRRGHASWGPSNRMLRYAVEEVVLYAAAWVTAGAVGTLVLLGQALVANVLQKAMSYVEHYGLERHETAQGTYERVTARHAWESRHRVTNWILLNRPRTADHHVTPTKRYQTLDPLHDSPKLPAGYGTMCLLALLPPVWFAVMNRRTRAWRVAHVPTR